MLMCIGSSTFQHGNVITLLLLSLAKFQAIMSSLSFLFYHYHHHPFFSEGEGCEGGGLLR